MGNCPPTDQMTRRIDAAIAEVYRTVSHRTKSARAESSRAMRALGAFGAPAVDRVLELYRDSSSGPLEHARLLNVLGNAAADAQVATRRAVAAACPRRYIDRLNGHLAATEIDVVAGVQDPRVTPMLRACLSDDDPRVRYRAATALVGRIEGKGLDDRRTREFAERAVLGLLDDEALAIRSVAAYSVARRSPVDGIVAYQQILRPTEQPTLMLADVQLRIAALRRGESMPPPV